MKKRIIKITLYLFIVFSAFCMTNITTYSKDNNRYEDRHENDDNDNESYDNNDNDNEEKNGDNEEKGGGWFNFDLGKMIEDWVQNKIEETSKFSIGDGIKIDGMFLKNVIYPEKNITILGKYYTEFSKFVKSIAMSVIILYTLWYGFKIYILWKDGNPEENPKEMAIRFISAMSIIMCYDEVLSIVSALVSEIINKIMEIGGGISGGTIGSATGTVLSVITIIGLIFAIIYWFQYWKMMFGTIKMGIELYVLRIGTPLACINIVHPQSNTWNAYILTFIKDYVGICLNVLLMQIGTKIFNSTSGGYFSALWAGAFLSLANGSKDLLNQFIVSSSNNMNAHSIGSVINYGSQVRNMLTKQAVKGAATGGAGVAIPPTP